MQSFVVFCQIAATTKGSSSFKFYIIHESKHCNAAQGYNNSERTSSSTIVHRLQFHSIMTEALVMNAILTHILSYRSIDGLATDCNIRARSCLQSRFVFNPFRIARFFSLTKLRQRSLNASHSDERNEKLCVLNSHFSFMFLHTCAVSGVDIHMITPITCVCCIFYTCVGGIKAGNV